MDQELKKIIQTQFKSLPENLQKSITAADLPQKIQTIGKRHGLLIDQMGDLETETTLVLLGLEPATEFTLNLKDALGVPTLIASKIADDVSNEIFHEVRESLQKIQNHSESEPTESAPSPTPQPIESKETILNEIENPTPAKSVAQPHVEAIIDPRNELDAGAKYIEKKLTQPSGYKADPYREPLQ